MNDKIKLHLGCGTVYLKDYINVDINVKDHHLASNRPDLVKLNKTDFKHYYKSECTKIDFIHGTYTKRLVVCDVFADVKNLPHKEDSVDEILGVQLFEHFTKHEAGELLDYWRRLLKVGGVLKLYVPDLDGIFEGYQKDKDVDWMIRQIYGSQKHEFSLHKYGYTKESLRQLLLDHRFKDVEILPNINDYPAFGIEAKK